MKPARTTGVLAVLLIGLSACGGGEEQVTIEGQQANSHGTEDVAGETSIEFELDDFYFEPTILRGEPGQEITLEAFNEGDELHNFSLPEQRIDQDLEPEGTAEIAITFPDSGRLVFTCKYHAAQGMIGALEAA